MSSILLALVLGQSSPCLDRFKKDNPAICTNPPTASCPVKEDDACGRLAVRAAENLKPIPGPGGAKGGAAVSSASLQGNRPGAAAPPASPMQLDAAQSVKTVGLAGASFGVEGRLASPSTLTGTVGLTVNPFGISSADDPEKFASWSRLADFSVLLPDIVFSGTAPDVLGLRARLDLLGAWAGRDLYRAMSDDAPPPVPAPDSEALSRQIQDALMRQSVAARSACLDQLLGDSVDPSRLGTVCGLNSLQGAGRTASPPARSDAAQLRRDAEDHQGGLVLQADLPVGRDSTLPTKLALTAVLGLRAPCTGAWRPGFLANLGADVVRAQNGTGAWGGMWALALTLDGAMEQQELHLSLGLQGHVGQFLNLPIIDIASQTGNYTNVETGLRVPLGARGPALGGRIAWPLSGNVGWTPVFSLVLDYNYLLD